MRNLTKEVKLIICIFLFFVFLVTLIERNNSPLKEFQVMNNRMKSILENLEETNSRQENNNSSTKMEVLRESENLAVKQEQYPKQPKNLAVEIKESSSPALGKTGDISHSEVQIVLHALSLGILKDISGSSYEKLMNATIMGKPLSNEARAQSQQIVIATTWRSGSTFLEELIESHPGLYNIYEPLLIYKMKNFYDPKDSETQEALKLVHELLNCRYTEEYIRKSKSASIEMFTRNKLLWKSCSDSSKKNELCFQKDFVEGACRLFPWRLMKLVRMSVALMKPILEDRNLNVHIIYLVRDPRGVMNSRRTTVRWCNQPSCNDENILCQHMDQDLEGFVKLSKEFPGKVHLLRYEDMALSPLNTTEKLLKAINLDFDPNMKTFIDTHTNKNLDKPWTTSRESSKRVSHWINKIDKTLLKNIENKCSSAMNKLGYKFKEDKEYASITELLEPVNL